MAPVPVIFSNQDEGAPGPSLLGTGDYNYDSRSMLMTTAAICATREVSWCPSFYRGEQYDSDLGLYYLRARYYNPATGRFMSRDPEDGKAKDPASLHKYLYANGDPVNGLDPTGHEGLTEYFLAVKKVFASPAFALAARAITTTCLVNAWRGIAGANVYTNDLDKAVAVLICTTASSLALLSWLAAL